VVPGPGALAAWPRSVAARPEWAAVSTQNMNFCQAHELVEGYAPGFQHKVGRYPYPSLTDQASHPMLLAGTDVLGSTGWFFFATRASRQS
jgi:hypothetical protein